MRSLNQKLKEGKVLLGVNIMYPAPGIVERIGPDWDFLWIDGQHGEHDYRSLLECVRASDLVGTESLLRVCGHDAGNIGRGLDMAASGLMIPQVDTREQAERIVQAVRMKPLGYRSFGGRRPIDMYGRSYAQSSNADIALVVQIESKLAIQNAEEIFSVKGVDGFFFGPDDVAMEEGLPMDEPRPQDIFAETLEKLIVTAKKCGIFGGGVFPTPESAARAVKMGYQLLAVGGDVGFVAGGSKEQAARMRTVVK